MYSPLTDVSQTQNSVSLIFYIPRLALEQEDKEQIDSVLANGEDINFMWTARTAWNMRNSIRGTPMSRYLIEFVAGSSSLGMVKFLLDRGARLEISNALHSATAAVGTGDENSTERVEIIAFLLEQGMDINKLEYAGEEDFAKQYWGRAYGTPLHYAASWGWPNIVECLLKNGADPEIEAVSYNRKVACGTALD